MQINISPPTTTRMQFTVEMLLISYNIIFSFYIHLKFGVLCHKKLFPSYPEATTLLHPSHHILTTEAFVQLDLPYLFASRVQSVLYVDLRRVIRVGAELHGAVLPVKREICYLDGETTGRLQGSGRRKRGANLEEFNAWQYFKFVCVYVLMFTCTPQELQ